MIARSTAIPCALLCALALSLPSAAAAQGGPAGRSPSPTGYWPSSTCAGCHPRIVKQHMDSQHEKSFTNPVFQAQYFEELLPKASRDPKLVAEAKGCTACHAPVAWAFSRGHFTGPMPTDPSMSGVTCDLCHTISAYDGPEPRNGNFISRPSDQKLGPFPSDTNWHHVYSQLQTQSELCATCHEAVNHNGVVVKGTYSEWKKSEFAANGVQCQDCHMTRDGYLRDGKASYESGKAAEGTNLQAPVRDRLFTHRFPGAHSRSQVEGAVGVAFARVPSQARPGDSFTFSITVDNHRTGHKLPTGSSDLRLLWLEVVGRAGARSFPVPAKVKAMGGYGTAGAGERDAMILAEAVPPGARTYRAVYFDAAGEQTLASYEAVRQVWDNRLEPGEKRNEAYEVTLPADLTGTLKLEARLVYLAYPPSFAKRLELAPAQPVEIGKATVEVALSSAPPPPAVLRGGPR